VGKGGGGGGGGGGAFMYIFVFGLVFPVSYLSEGRYNPSSETYSSTSRVCVLPI